MRRYEVRVTQEAAVTIEKRGGGGGRLVVTRQAIGGAVERSQHSEHLASSMAGLPESLEPGGSSLSGD